jgi:predicted amidophosphoribosyltransferase
MSLDIFLQIAIGLVSYILLLFILKKMNIWNKKQCDNCNNCCPGCQEPLERIKRRKIDILINYMTLQIFNFKKYRCLNCAWEGRRWERSFSGKF